MTRVSIGRDFIYDPDDKETLRHLQKYCRMMEVALKELPPPPAGIEMVQVWRTIEEETVRG